jgi:hypothetical protein
VAADAPTAFFSYCREDSDFALRLAEDLKAAGANVWIDQLDIEPGQRWDRAVEDALNNCPRMLVILSPVSVKSDNVRDEISVALRKQKTVIPVLYRDCDIPLRLERHQHIDFRTDHARGLKVLLKALGVEQRAAAAPAVLPESPATVAADEGEQVTELARLEADRRLAAERAALEAERRQLAAAKEQLEKQERERVAAAEKARLEEEQRQAAERALEAERKQVEAQERLEQQRKREAEQAWLKERRKQAAEQDRLERRERVKAAAAEKARFVEVKGQDRRAAEPPRERKAPKSLTVWDVPSGHKPLTVKGHSGTVHGLAVSADGRLAISASEDKTLKVWDLQSARTLRTLQGHSDQVNSVAWWGHGQPAVSASRDNTVKMWDVESGTELRTLKGPSDWFGLVDHGAMNVAVSADGRRVVCGYANKTLQVWNWHEVAFKALFFDLVSEPRTLKGHSGWVCGVAMSADGRRAVSASKDETLKVWDLDSGREMRTLTGHSAAVYRVALTADGRTAVSASGDRTLKVWDVDSGRELRTLSGHSAGIVGLALTEDGKHAVSSADDGLKLWDLENGLELATFTEGETIMCCAISADEKTLVAGDMNGAIYYLRLE